MYILFCTRKKHLFLFAVAVAMGYMKRNVARFYPYQTYSRHEFFRDFSRSNSYQTVSISSGASRDECKLGLKNECFCSPQRQPKNITGYSYLSFLTWLDFWLFHSYFWVPIKATKGRSEWPFGHLTRFLNAALVSVSPSKYMQQGECIALHSTSVRVCCLHLAPAFSTGNVRRGLVGYRVWGRERRTKKSIFFKY